MSSSLPLEWSLAPNATALTLLAPIQARVVEAFPGTAAVAQPSAVFARSELPADTKFLAKACRSIPQLLATVDGELEFDAASCSIGYRLHCSGALHVLQEGRLRNTPADSIFLPLVAFADVPAGGAVSADVLRAVSPSPRIGSFLVDKLTSTGGHAFTVDRDPAAYGEDMHLIDSWTVVRDDKPCFLKVPLKGGMPVATAASGAGWAWDDTPVPAAATAALVAAATTGGAPTGGSAAVGAAMVPETDAPAAAAAVGGAAAAPAAAVAVPGKRVDTFRLYIGGYTAAYDPATVSIHRVGYIINCATTDHLECSFGALGVRYAILATDDSGGIERQPISKQDKQYPGAYWDHALPLAAQAASEGHGILSHCWAGINRSVTTASLFLVLAGRATSVVHGIERIQKARHLAGPMQVYVRFAHKWLASVLKAAKNGTSATATGILEAFRRVRSQSPHIVHARAMPLDPDHPANAWAFEAGVSDTGLPSAAYDAYVKQSLGFQALMASIVHAAAPTAGAGGAAAVASVPAGAIVSAAEDASNRDHCKGACVVLTQRTPVPASSGGDGSSAASAAASGGRAELTVLCVKDHTTKWTVPLETKPSRERRSTCAARAADEELHAGAEVTQAMVSDARQFKLVTVRHIKRGGRPVGFTPTNDAVFINKQPLVALHGYDDAAFQARRAACERAGKSYCFLETTAMCAIPVRNLLALGAADGTSSRPGSVGDDCVQDVGGTWRSLRSAFVHIVSDPAVRAELELQLALHESLTDYAAGKSAPVASAPPSGAAAAAAGGVVAGGAAAAPAGGAVTVQAAAAVAGYVAAAAGAAVAAVAGYVASAASGTAAATAAPAAPAAKSLVVPPGLPDAVLEHNCVAACIVALQHIDICGEKTLCALLVKDHTFKFTGPMETRDTLPKSSFMEPRTTCAARAADEELHCPEITRAKLSKPTAYTLVSALHDVKWTGDGATAVSLADLPLNDAVFISKGPVAELAGYNGVAFTRRRQTKIAAGVDYCHLETTAIAWVPVRSLLEAASSVTAAGADPFRVVTKCVDASGSEVVVRPAFVRILQWPGVAAELLAQVEAAEEAAVTGTAATA